MTDCLVSIIIPVKNRCRMLQDALEGIARQSFDHASMELVVVDNVSTDDVRGVVEAFAERADFPVRYLRMTRDRGPAPARNAGARLATGAVLAFTDSDCRPHPDWLREGLAGFTDGVALVSGVVTFKPEQPTSFFSKLSAETLEEHPTYPTANVFYRRALFWQHGGFDEALSFRDPFDRAVECADTDLAWRLKTAGYRSVFRPAAVVYHEVELLSPLGWLLEPTRLFVLPLLVRRHPELRRRLLLWNLVFYRGSLLLYLLLAVAAVLAWIDPRLLLVLPVLGLVRSGLATRSASLRRLLPHFGQSILHVGRLAIMTAALLYGSVRHRSVVL